MGQEYELKFRATPELLRQVLEAFPGQLQKIAMETTYYDTEKQEISRRKYTLRRRLENGVSICTLKTPAGGAARKEFEVRCDRIEDAIPELCKLGAPGELLHFTNPVPVCGARFTRIADTISFDGSILELAMDDGVLLGGGREIPMCEIEVELKAGSASDCDNFGALLAEKFRLQPEEKSKFCRAYALYKGERHV